MMVNNIERVVDAAPGVNFVERICAHIARHSVDVAGRCRPHLEALGVDALMQRGAGRFTLEQHTRLIEVLTELEGDQLRNLVASPDPSMSPQEIAFYQHHLRLARYERLYREERAQAAPSLCIPDINLIRERCQTYFDMHAWNELVSLIRSSRDGEELDVLVQACFRRIVGVGGAEAFDPIERAFAAYSGMENNTAHTDEHLRNIETSLSDYRALRDLEGVLERIVQSNDDAAISEAVAIITPLSGRCHMPMWTSIFTVTENRASLKGYKRIIDVLLNRNLVERAEEIVLAISNEYEKGVMSSYLARRLLERENIQAPLGREILQAMLSQLMMGPLSSLIRAEGDASQISALVERAVALARQLPTDDNCQSRALAALRELILEPLHDVYSLSIAPPVEEAPAVEVEQSSDVEADPVEGLSFIDRAYACLNWIKHLLQVLLNCIRGR